MFTIRKRYKIQVFHLNFSNPSAQHITTSIDTVSWVDVVNYLRRFTESRVDEVIHSQYGSISSELDAFWIRELKKFFTDNPSAWSDLKRKIHKYRSSDGDTYHIKKGNEEYIFPIFLRLKNSGNMNISFEDIVRKEILKNTRLIKQISWEPSILDSSHGNLSFLANASKKHKIAYIKKMIEFWIRANSNLALNEDVLEGKAQVIIPKILHYLQSIFNISFTQLPQWKTITIWKLSEYLADQIWGDSGDKSGIKSKKAWTLVKAFSAWGSYETINAIRTKWKSQISQMQSKLAESWIQVVMSDPKDEINGWSETVTIHPGNVSLTLNNGSTFTCIIEYRLKSMRSILLKMWENEEYTNIDAMRDIIGIAIIWPNNTLQDTKIEVIWQFTQIMSHKSYLLKNKWLLITASWTKDWAWKSDIKQLNAILKESISKPLGGMVSHKSEKTDAKFINASISGFTAIGSDDIWLEIQFFDQWKYDFWKKNHYEFDPLKVISAWSRGSWFLTPHQVLYCIQKEIPSTIRDDNNLWRPQDIFYNYLKSRKLIAYIWSSDEVYITPGSHDAKFQEKFNWTWIRRVRIQWKSRETDERREEDWFKDFISNLKTNFSPSTL